jgi:hypothetical protein
MMKGESFYRAERSSGGNKRQRLATSRGRIRPFASTCWSGVSGGIPAQETGGDRRKGTLLIEPALATSIERVPSGDRWIHEIKFDGYRVQAHLVNEAVKIFTRRGNDWTNRFRKVADDAWHIAATLPFGSVAATVGGICLARGALPVINRPHCRERAECTPTRSGRKVGWTCSISVGSSAQ